MFLWTLSVWAQSPHGNGLKIDCAKCHNPSGWELDRETLLFDHSTTEFELQGAHATTDCKSCHTSMIFNEVDNQCIDCHTDIHYMTVGENCARCHDAGSWLVYEIPEIHEQNGFPLMGAHANLSCVECHTSESILRFDRLGNECINCHDDDYANTQNPNHEQAGYSLECLDCHNPLGFGWNADVITHDFFPLTKGHDIQDCNECHTTGNFSDASPECVNCHQSDFAATMNPNHQSLGFSNDCAACHTTDPGWKPAAFDEHDAQFFPIYSGNHEGEWNSCTECHPNPSNYAEFTCLTCHTNPETDNDHNGISGYSYESNACLACHPTGDEDGAFDHNRTNFPLTGAHTTVNCGECHVDGYAGTPTHCDACHLDDYNNASDPNHVSANFPTDCAACHTTDPGWKPATFDHDDQYFPIYRGDHRGEWDSCTDCHTNPNDYSEFTCTSCHRKSGTDSEHQGVSGYVYESSACFSCHPNP